MRVAGEDEGVDADAPILVHPLGDGRRVADQRRPCPAPHQPDARPEVRADLEPVAPPVM